jgi:MFS family permease
MQIGLATAAEARPVRTNEWKAGWTVVLAAFFGVSIAAMQTNAMGVLVKPLSEAYGWTRAQISLAPLFVSMGTLALSPVIGSVVDRMGARRVVLWGVPLYAVTLASIALAGGNLMAFYLFYALLAIVGPVVGPMTWSLGVASRFDAQRGLALGISMAGMAALGTVTPILTQLTLERIGVGYIWVALGCVAFTVGFPLAAVFFYDAGDMRTRPAGGRAAGRHRFAGGSSHAGLTFAQALGSRRFWQLACAMVIAAATCGLFTIHFASMLTDRGMGAREAALVLGVMSPSTMIGRIAGGFLLDRFFAPRVAAFTLSLPLVACFVMLLGGTSTPLAILVGIAMGFALGSEGDTLAYLAARYFGLKSYGKVYGLLFGLYGLGFGSGSFLGGTIFEATGSYRGIWMLFVLVLPVAIALVAALGRYPRFEAEEGHA